MSLCCDTPILKTKPSPELCSSLPTTSFPYSLVHWSSSKQVPSTALCPLHVLRAHCHQAAVLTQLCASSNLP
jgi:hypothetical protein